MRLRQMLDSHWIRHTTFCNQSEKRILLHIIDMKQTLLHIGFSVNLARVTISKPSSSQIQLSLMRAWFKLMWPILVIERINVHFQLNSSPSDYQHHIYIPLTRSHPLIERGAFSLPYGASFKPRDTQIR